MSFDRRFLQIEGSVNKVDVSGTMTNSPVLISYRSDDDTLATILTANYFKKEEVYGTITNGSLAFIVGSDGSKVGVFKVATNGDITVDNPIDPIPEASGIESFEPAKIQLVGVSNTDTSGYGAPATLICISDSTVNKMASDDFWGVTGTGLEMIDKYNSLKVDLVAGSLLVLHSTTDNETGLMYIASNVNGAITLANLAQATVATAADLLFDIRNLEMSFSSVAVNDNKDGFRLGDKDVATLFQYKDMDDLAALIADGTFGITRGINIGDSVEIDPTRASFLDANVKTGDFFAIAGSVDGVTYSGMIVRANVAVDGVVTLVNDVSIFI